jgi:protein-S-isoprenylcysteine O-methyltransferase Ste14
MERDRPRLVTLMTTPRLMLITIIGTLVYLGLAILGWGGFAAFFSYPALIALAITLLVLSGVAVFSGRNLSPRYARGSYQPLGHRGLRADRNCSRHICRRIWPVFVLGHGSADRCAVQPRHALVTTGLYRVVRHPSYLGLLVNSLGWALAFRAGVGVLLTALVIPPLVARIRAEEKLLRSPFGDD